ncbi:MAG: DNA double-strand break repair nuclease NurA [Mahellales bacterium]|jgi:hypothetical protein
MGVLNIDKIISEKMNYVNQQLKNKYHGLNRDKDKKIKDILLKRAVRSIKLSRKVTEAVKELAGGRPLVGVDGSINMVGSSYPHYLALIRAMAKSTCRDHGDIVLVDVHYPGFPAQPSKADSKASSKGLPGASPQSSWDAPPKGVPKDFPEVSSQPTLDAPSKAVLKAPSAAVPGDSFTDRTYDTLEGGGISKAAADENRRSARMAQLEIEAATESLRTMDPFLIMLDGSLVQYRIKCRQAWEEFSTMALNRGVLVVGVIEEIKTDFLYPVIKHDIGWDTDILYDRELLFGLLDVGEMLVVDEGVIQPSKEGLATCFVRSSRDPHPIALDMLKEQEEYLYDTACLVYSLTPKDGRGIPLWLDIVDREVRITDRMMESLVDCYIDEDLRYRLLRPKRENRGY